MAKDRDKKATHWNESSYLISYPKYILWCNRLEGVPWCENASFLFDQNFISFRYENNVVHFVSITGQSLLYARYYDTQGNAYQLPDLKDINYDHFIFTPDSGYQQIPHAIILSYGIIKEVEWRIPDRFQYHEKEPRIMNVPQGVLNVAMVSSNFMIKPTADSSLPALPVVSEEGEHSVSVNDSPLVDEMVSEENEFETGNVADSLSTAPSIGTIPLNAQREDSSKDSILFAALNIPSDKPVVAEDGEITPAIPTASPVASARVVTDRDLVGEPQKSSWAQVAAQTLPARSNNRAPTPSQPQSRSPHSILTPAPSQPEPKSRSRQTVKAAPSLTSRSTSLPAVDQWQVVGRTSVVDFPPLEPVKSGNSWAGGVLGNKTPPQQEVAKPVILPALDNEATKDDQPLTEVKPSTEAQPKKAKKPSKVPATKKAEADIDSLLAEFSSPSLSQQDLLALLTTPARFIKKLRENIKSLTLEDVVALHGKISDLPDKERAEAAVLLIKQHDHMREPDTKKPIKNHVKKRSQERGREIIIHLTPEQAKAIVQDATSTEQTLKENCHTVQDWHMIYRTAYLNKRLDLVDAIRQQLGTNPIEMSTLAVHIFPLIAAEVNDYDYLMEVLGRLGEKNMFKAQTYRTNPGEENQLVHSFLTDYLHLTKTLNLDIMKFFAVKAKNINFSAAHPVNPYFYMHNGHPMLMSAMEICVAREFCEGIEYLHRELNVSIVTTTIEWSLVCFAAVSNKLESLKTLCRLGANIDDVVEERGVNLLDIVLSRASNFFESTNYLEMLEYLVYQTALTTQISFEDRDVAKVNLMRLNIATRDLATRLPPLMKEIARRSPDGGMQYEPFAAEIPAPSSNIEEGGAVVLHFASFNSPAEASKAFEHVKRIVSKSEASRSI